MSPKKQEWIASAIHSGAWLYTLLIIGFPARFVKMHRQSTGSLGWEGEFAQDRRAARTGGGRDVGGPSVQRFVGQQREGNGLFRVVGQAEGRVRGKAGRGQPRGQKIRQSPVMDTAAAQNDGLNRRAGQQPVTISTSNGFGGERCRGRQGVSGRTARALRGLEELLCEVRAEPLAPGGFRRRKPARRRERLRRAGR